MISCAQENTHTHSFFKKIQVLFWLVGLGACLD